MGTLPQLTEEDIHRLDDILRELLTQSDATTALIIDLGGFLITSQGESRQFDLTTIAALAAGAYMANQTIAGLVHETNFNSIYQAGDHFSMFAMRVDDQCLMVVVFKALVGVGAVKYFSGPATQAIAKQLMIAAERAPGAGLDLSVLNVADTSDLFKKKPSNVGS
jgi:predicted regulator of Ras-like GTPase activity (Roadblock/LC7/MglB family)